MSPFKFSSQARPQAGQAGGSDTETFDAVAPLSESSISAEVQATQAVPTDAQQPNKDGFFIKKQLSSVLDNK